MPYKSAAQRRFMHARHPKIAARWDKKYGGGGPNLREKAAPSRDSVVRRLSGLHDSRSTQGELARGKPTYNGTGAAHRGGGPQFGRPVGSRDKVPARSSVRRKLAARRRAR